MTTLAEIEAAILLLPSEDFRRLSEWLVEQVQQRWDEQLEGDVVGGKLDLLTEEAIADFKAGRYRSL